ncbi:choice-of-anchor M domain-containing protein, partial [Conexibacter stalactiti]
MNCRAIAGAILGLVCLAAPAAAADPGLDQRIDAEQAVASGRKVLAGGHVDVGPRFVGGRWTLMIHDDAAKADAGGRSVWRHPERTVLRVTDAALRQVPEDPAYGFLGAAPGREVFVVPQTQNPEVVWVGWNTQDPRVMETIDRGVRLTLAGVEGPGALTVYLQSGDFAAPQVLWSSTGRARPVWVDVNTHTHANWVFSKPGVYLVRVRVTADLVDGSTVTDTRALRFAVGSGTDVEEAFAARPSADEPAASPSASTTEDAAEDSGSSALIAALAVVAAALAVAVAAVAVRGGRAKRRARARARDA